MKEIFNPKIIMILFILFIVFSNKALFMILTIVLLSLFIYGLFNKLEGEGWDSEKP